MSAKLDPSTLTLLASAITFAVPYVSAIFTQAKFPRWVNDLIAFVISAVAGTVAFLQSGGTLDGVHSLATLIVVIGGISTGAKIYYKTLAQHTPLIDALEFWTSPRTGRITPPNDAFSSSAEAAFGNILHLGSLLTGPAATPSSNPTPTQSEKQNE